MPPFSVDLSPNAKMILFWPMMPFYHVCLANAKTKTNDDSKKEMSTPRFIIGSILFVAGGIVQIVWSTVLLGSTVVISIAVSPFITIYTWIQPILWYDK